MDTGALHPCSRNECDRAGRLRKQHLRLPGAFPYLLDVDRYANVVATARDSVLQASGTLTNFVLSKMGLSKVTGPFPHSIARTIESFYNCRDPRRADRPCDWRGRGGTGRVGRTRDRFAIPQQEVLFLTCSFLRLRNPQYLSWWDWFHRPGAGSPPASGRSRHSDPHLQSQWLPQNCTASRSNLQRRLY